MAVQLLNYILCAISFLRQPKYSDAFQKMMHTHIRVLFSVAFFLYTLILAMKVVLHREKAPTTLCSLGWYSHRCNSNCSNITFSVFRRTTKSNHFISSFHPLHIQVTSLVLTIITWCWKIVSALSSSVRICRDFWDFSSRIFHCSLIQLHKEKPFALEFY